MTASSREIKHDRKKKDGEEGRVSRRETHKYRIKGDNSVRNRNKTKNEDEQERLFVKDSVEGRTIVFCCYNCRVFSIMIK